MAAFQAGVIEGQLRIDGKQFQIFSQQVNTAQRQMAGQAGTTGSAFKSLWKQMAVGLGVAGGVALAIRAINNQFKDTIKKGREFEREWANVTTMLSVSERETKKMRDELLKLSPTLGDTTILAKGMYQVLSASIEPAKAIEFLGEAAKSAKAGVTDAKTAVDALTTVINAYGMEAEDVTGISDIMFQTVKRGKLTYEELANALGTVVPVAATVGVEFDDVAAAVATMTRQGIDAQTATMQLRQVMMAILKPGDEAQKMAKDLGIEWSAAGLKAKGLGEFMRELKEKTGANSEVLAKLVPNVRALSGVMILAGEGAEGFKTDLELMTKASGSTEEAFRKQMKSMDFWMETAKTTVDKLKIAFYEGLVTPFREGIETSADLDKNIKDLIDTFSEFGKIIGTVLKTGFGKFMDKIETSIGTFKTLNFLFEGMTLAIKKGQIPTLKNAAIAWAENKKEADSYAGILEHLEKWLSLTKKKTDDTVDATRAFTVSLDDCHKAIARINARQLTRELEEIYDSLKDVEIAVDDLGIESEETIGIALPSILDNLGIKIAGINIQAQTAFTSMAEYYEDLANRWQAAYIETIQPTMETSEELLTEYYGYITQFCSDVDSSWHKMTDSMVEAFMEWGEGTSNILETLGENLGNFIDDVIAGIGRMLMSMVTDTIRQWILKQTQALAAGIASVMAALPFPFNVAAIGGMLMLVKAAFAKIRKLEKGGRVPSRQIVEVAEREPEWIIPESKMGEFAQRYERGEGRQGRQGAEAQTVLQPINLNVDGKNMAKAVAKYSVELSKDGIWKFHVVGLTDK